MAMIVSPFFEDNLFVFSTVRRSRPVQRRYSLNPYRSCRYNPFGLNVFEDFENQTRNRIERSKETDTSYETFYNFNGYDPKDIEVAVDPKSGEITVKGSKTEKSDCAVFQKHFQRSFILPESAKLDQIKTQMNKEGVLNISVPKDQDKIKQPATTDDNKATQVGKEPIEVENIPEVKDGEMSNPDVIPEEKYEDMDEKETTKSVLKVPVEVEETDMETEELETPFQFTMDIKGFNPNELEVQMNQENGTLSIHATKRVEKEGTVFMNQIHRDLSLDGGKFDLNKLNCVIDNETLIVTAPRSATLTSDSRKNIPITFKN